LKRVKKFYKLFTVTLQSNFHESLSVVSSLINPRKELLKTMRTATGRRRRELEGSHFSFRKHIPPFSHAFALCRLSLKE
jgi:hypothetical protein